MSPRSLALPPEPALLGIQALVIVVTYARKDPSERSFWNPREIEPKKNRKAREKIRCGRGTRPTTSAARILPWDDRQSPLSRLFSCFSFIYPSIHPSIHLFIHSLVRSFVRSFTQSLYSCIHLFIYPCFLSCLKTEPFGMDQREEGQVVRVGYSVIPLHDTRSAVSAGARSSRDGRMMRDCVAAISRGGQLKLTVLFCPNWHVSLCSDPQLCEPFLQRGWRVWSHRQTKGRPSQIKVRRKSLICTLPLWLAIWENEKDLFQVSGRNGFWSHYSERGSHFSVWNKLPKRHRGNTLFCRAVTSILSQRLLHKMMNSSQFW